MGLKKDDTVYFKLKLAYKQPLAKGTVKGRCKNLVWIKMDEIKGKKLNDKPTVCVHKRNIF